MLVCAPSSRRWSHLCVLSCFFVCSPVWMYVCVQWRTSCPRRAPWRRPHITCARCWRPPGPPCTAMSPLVASLLHTCAPWSCKKHKGPVCLLPRKHQREGKRRSEKKEEQSSQKKRTKERKKEKGEEEEEGKQSFSPCSSPHGAPVPGRSSSDVSQHEGIDKAAAFLSGT